MLIDIWLLRVAPCMESMKVDKSIAEKYQPRGLYFMGLTYASGIKSQGSVIDPQEHRPYGQRADRYGRSRRDSKAYVYSTVAYRFATQEGRSIEMAGRRVDRLYPQGGLLDVLYDPAAPDRCVSDAELSHGGCGVVVMVSPGLGVLDPSCREKLPTPMTRKTAAINLATAVIPLAFGVGAFVLVWGSYRDAARRHALFATGARAEGAITGTRAHRPRRVVNSYYIAYRFTVDGRTFEVRDREVLRSDYRGLHEGKRIDVWYNPADPSVCVSEPERRYTDWGWSSDAALYALVGVICLGVGVVLVVKSVRVLTSDTPGPGP